MEAMRHSLENRPDPIIKLVAVAKNEGLYIPSWVHHHFRIGVDYIEIHINDTDDNSIEICKRRKELDDRFDFIQSDALLEKSIKEGTSFQKNIYNQSLEQIKSQDKNISHILKLDLDEYLTPVNLNSDIKSLIKSSPSVDVFSFLWYSDDFNEKSHQIQLPFKDETIIYRMNHVKSMAKISRDLSSCTVHNFKFRSGHDPSSQLADLSNTSHQCFNQGMLDRNFLESLNPSQPEHWFILHCMYRSEPEYLASLYRGNKQNNDSNLLKRNRWGRKPCPNFPSKPIIFSPPATYLAQYRMSYRAFITNSNLQAEVEKAQQYLMNKIGILDQLISDNPIILNTYYQCFRGTRYDPTNDAPTAVQRRMALDTSFNKDCAVEKFDTERFFSARPDILQIYKAGGVADGLAFTNEMNDFYNANKTKLDEFTLSEFGFWHTQFFQDKYLKKGQGGDYWMKKNAD